MPADSIPTAHPAQPHITITHACLICIATPHPVYCTPNWNRRLDAAHALIDAYKHHLSDEVASHHQREETWMQVQQEWEKLEKELSTEIDR